MGQLRTLASQKCSGETGAPATCRNQDLDLSLRRVGGGFTTRLPDFALLHVDRSLRRGQSAGCRVRSRTTATEDRRWIIGTAIHLRRMAVRAVRRLQLRTIGQREHSAHYCDCKCNEITFAVMDNSSFIFGYAPPAAACAAPLQCRVDTWRFDCSRVGGYPLLRTFC
jgi:hypothetical protein